MSTARVVYNRILVEYRTGQFVYPVFHGVVREGGVGIGYFFTHFRPRDVHFVVEFGKVNVMWATVLAATTSPVPVNETTAVSFVESA